jgi:hypothetical protein
MEYDNVVQFRKRVRLVTNLLALANTVYDGDYLTTAAEIPGAEAQSDTPLYASTRNLVIERVFPDQFVPPVDFAKGYFGDMPFVGAEKILCAIPSRSVKQSRRGSSFAMLFHTGRQHFTNLLTLGITHFFIAPSDLSIGHFELSQHRRGIWAKKSRALAKGEFKDAFVLATLRKCPGFCTQLKPVPGAAQPKPNAVIAPPSAGPSAVRYSRPIIGN